jgi:transposase
MPGTKYSAEMRVRAVRLVREHSEDYPSEWAAITEVARRLGIGSAETLRKWLLRQAGTAEGVRPGRTTGRCGARG